LQSETIEQPQQTSNQADVQPILAAISCCFMCLNSTISCGCNNQAPPDFVVPHGMDMAGSRSTLMAEQVRIQST
jgi:hypothetical protein